jgi:hypothetical protein
MKLTFKPPHVRNTVITNEQGHVLYSTSTSFSFDTRVTRVKKHVPNEFNIGKVESSELLAEIEWHTFSSTVIKYGGQDLLTSQFIPTKGILGRWVRLTEMSVQLFQCHILQATCFCRS